MIVQENVPCFSTKLHMYIVAPHLRSHNIFNKVSFTYLSVTSGVLLTMTYFLHECFCKIYVMRVLFMHSFFFFPSDLQ